MVRQMEVIEEKHSLHHPVAVGVVQGVVEGMVVHLCDTEDPWSMNLMHLQGVDHLMMS